MVESMPVVPVLRAAAPEERAAGPCAYAHPEDARPDPPRRVSGRAPRLALVMAALPVLTLLPLLGFAVVLLGLLADARRAEVERDLRNAAGSLALSIEVEIDGTIRRLQTLAELPVAHETPSDLPAVAAGELRRDPSWNQVLLTDVRGRILQRIAPRDDAAYRSVDVAVLRAHDRQALDTGRAAVSDVFLSRATGRPRIGVSVPVVRDGRTVALLSAGLSPEALAARLAQVASRHGGVGVLVDREGRVVAHSDDLADWFGRPLPAAVLERIASRPRGGGPDEDPETRADRIDAWARLPFGWTVVMWQPHSGFARILGPIGALGVLGMALLAASLALSRAVVRRIIGLVERAGRAAEDVAAARPPRLDPPSIRRRSTSSVRSSSR